MSGLSSPFAWFPYPNLSLYIDLLLVAVSEHEQGMQLCRKSALQLLFKGKEIEGSAVGKTERLQKLSHLVGTF